MHKNKLSVQVVGSLSYVNLFSQITINKQNLTKVPGVKLQVTNIPL